MRIYPTKNQYLIFIAMLGVMSSSVAESYVFGGRAHFQGVLMNQGCSVLVSKEQSPNIKTPTIPIEVNFSLCPVGIYDNLTISLSELESLTKGEFYIDAQNRNVIYLNNELNIPSLNLINVNQRFIHHIDLPTEYDSFSKNTMSIFMNQSYPEKSTLSSNILISVFYP